MTDDYFLSIIEEMDRLWFHQIILLSEATASVVLKPSQTPPLLPESFSCPASTLSLPVLAVPDELTSSSTDVSPCSEIEASSESISVSLQDDSNNVEQNKERPTRIKLLDSRVRSHPPTPTAQNRARKSRKERGLQKSMSCRTMGELEIEEVKGFMDLGFIFKQENINPRMMNLVPGLQRLGTTITETKKNPQVMDEQLEQEEEQRDNMRPYLSEAWLIKRPDSPLLNLKIPKLCSSAHMKKHLRFWARTVASEIHLNECHATNQF